MLDEPVTYLERLREVAIDQHGFVTTAQAQEVGVPLVELYKMAARGRIEQVVRSVFRIPQVPGSRWDNWALAVLGTGAPEACLSHETALAAWEISDINPDRIHIWVGRNRRLRRSGGDGYVVHHGDLAPEQRAWFQQIPITTVSTTICQCIDWGVPTYLIEQALGRAGRTSLLLKSERELLEERLVKRDYSC